jgi:flagellar FliL protein
VPEETVPQEPAKPASSFSIGKILLIVGLALASSAGGGFLSFVLINRTLRAEAKAAEKPGAETDERIVEALGKSAVLPLEPFVVNLADADSARYLRIKINLMVDDKSKTKELLENQALLLKVRDVILQSLTAKTSKDLISEDGKNKLREEIREKIALYFREPKLVEVIFTEFVIQL